MYQSATRQEHRASLRMRGTQQPLILHRSRWGFHFALLLSLFILFGYPQKACRAQRASVDSAKLQLAATSKPPGSVEDKKKPCPGFQNYSVPPLSLPGYITVRMNMGLPEIQRLHSLWVDIQNRHNPETAFGKQLSILPSPVHEQWRNLSKLMPTWSSDEKLQNINGFFNRWKSGSDQKNYGMEEYWATPEEFLEKGGDCEDFAIAKYLALRYFGWPEENLWILLAKDLKTKESHAATVARDQSKVFVLDNLSRPVYLLIPEKQYVKNFSPLFALNNQGIWMFIKSDDNPQQLIGTDKKEPLGRGEK